MKLRDIASKDPNVHSGDLVFSGTRVPVQHFVAYLAGGDTIDTFLEHFPTVDRRQAKAFLKHALDDFEACVDQEGEHATRSA